MERRSGSVRVCIRCLVAAALLLAIHPLPSAASEHSGELVAGESLFGGVKFGIAWQRTFSGPLAATANAEWAETPSKSNGETIYRNRFAYVGVGARWRFRRQANLHPFLGVGVGLGKLSYPFVRSGWSGFDPGRREFAWFGFGFDAQVNRRVRLVCESRMEFVTEGQASIRLGVQVPVRDRTKD